MALATDIKNRLGLYLAGSSTLQQFQEWLDHQETADDADARKMTLAVEWEFCDFERGASTAVDLRERLLALASGRPQVAQVFVDSVPQQSPVIEPNRSLGKRERLPRSAEEIKSMKRCFSCLRADNRKFERSAEICEECIDFPGKFQVPEFAVPYSGDDAAPRRGLVVSDGHSRVHIRSDKLQALAALLMQTGYVGGGMTLDEPCKSPLRDRIASRARRAGNEARRAENLKELQYLLDKNPEVARILELLEAAGERDFV